MGWAGIGAENRAREDLDCTVARNMTSNLS